VNRGKPSGMAGLKQVKTFHKLKNYSFFSNFYVIFILGQFNNQNLSILFVQTNIQYSIKYSIPIFKQISNMIRFPSKAKNINIEKINCK
jgi:hypothetical protein